MSHAHHDHTHTHSSDNFNVAFALAVLLNATFTIIEAIYAWRANSNSLLADAGHNLGDVAGLLLAWIANWLHTRPSSPRYSYGLKKTSILSALINALLLVLTSIGIAYEAIQKLLHGTQVNEHIVIIVALIGIVINGATALLFMRGRDHDLNIKSAFLHLAYDALISFGVVLAGILMIITKWHVIDPIVGLLIVFTIIAGTWHLLSDAINLILDGVPRHIQLDDVAQYLKTLPGVSAVHDIHIWGLSTNEVALTAHLVMPAKKLTDAQQHDISETLKHRFAIHHSTLQVEQGDYQTPCAVGFDCHQ